MHKLNLYSGKSEGNSPNQFFNQLYQELYPKLLSYGLKKLNDKHVIEDFIQEIFADAWQKRNKRQIVNLEAYLKTALRHKIYKSSNNKLYPINLSSRNSADAINNIEIEIIAREVKEEQRTRLNAAIKKLSEGERRVLNMRYLDGLSYKDIAKITKRKERTLYNQVASAILRLSNAFK